MHDQTKHHSSMRLLAGGLTAVAIGALAGYAFLSLLPARAAAPAPVAASKIATEEVGIKPASPPPAIAEEALRSKAPSQAPSAHGDAAKVDSKPAPQSRKVPSVPRFDIDEEELADIIDDLRLPLEIGGIHLRW